MNVNEVREELLQWGCPLDKIDEVMNRLVGIKENNYPELIDTIIPALEEFSEGLFTEDGITTIDDNTCEFIIDEVVHEDLAGKKMRVTVELVN